jgi:hypothetical protein
MFLFLNDCNLIAMHCPSIFGTAKVKTILVIAKKSETYF